VTIYHGTDGVDGSAPKVSIRKAQDGEYYWTADGEWMTDENGEMIPAVVADDPDGEYVTPQFRVADGKWYVSLDNGNTWRLCDIHDNTANEQIFCNIEVVDGYIILTIADGTRLKILTVNELEDSQTLVNKLNVNISSLQAIVMAMKMSDYITSVIPLTERSMIIGYIINFAQTKSVTIYYNLDEKDLYDRNLPVVGVRKMSDGIYYWTVNGNLYLRENGSKVPVLSNNDSAPILKISDGFWYISFDDGTTWRQVPITDNDGETNVKVAYSLVHGNRYSSGHLTEQTRASIVPYTVTVPAGVTIRPKDGYVWGWYTNVNTVDPANSNLASGGWVTSTYTGNGSAIGVTVKKTNDSVIDFSIDGYSPGDYLIASDPSIWYFDDDSAVIQVNQIFSSVDVSNANYLTLTLADGTVIKIHTLKGIEEKESNYWSNKSFACIGDSITEGAGTTKTYWEFLDETLSPLSMTAMGVSGSCVSAMSDYGTRNSPLINRYTSIPDADVITIYMGTNDYGHETPLGTIDDKGDISFYGALNTIIPGIIAAHPGSRLIWITPTHRYGRGTSGILGTTFTYDYIPNGRGHCLKDYVDAIKAVCERHSIPVIDLFNISGMDPSISEVRSAYMPDGLHPNEAGHKKIAAIIAASLEGLRWSIGTEPEDDTNTTYSYVPLTPGILSPNDSYRRVSLFTQDGQDGTIYKGLSFRGDGNGKVTIKDIEACSTVATMKWDKADKIKPHDNSLTKRFDFGKDIPINISWTLNSTYRTATGLLETGSRAVSPKLCLPFYSDINLTISSCTFIVSCYDSNDTYLGQITPSLDGLSKSTTQWLTAGTRITGDIIKAIAPNIHHISLVANKNEYPTYNATYTGETYHIYSNVYNTYSSQEDKHIGECCVYSVAGDGKIWSNSLQQLLKIGFISDSTLWPVASETRPYGNFVVDNENQYLYVFVMYSSKSLTYWYKFALPSVNDGEWSDTYGCKVKVLNEEDILDSWTTPHQNYIQGACVYDGLIWSTEGFTATSGTNVARMRVIDPHKKSEIAVFNFFSDGDPIEPEFVDFYNDRCYYGSVKQMYILDLL
jgi:lysophospholipase L1-like esterase